MDLNDVLVVSAGTLCAIPSDCFCGSNEMKPSSEPSSLWHLVSICLTIAQVGKKKRKNEYVLDSYIFNYIVDDSKT
jgi:hypothetical protein